MIREIVKINEELCDGCGQCIPNCHEGALQIIDGKARLVSELMCDGLGACLGHCPQGAISIERRQAVEYDEVAVIAQMIKSGKATVLAHLKHLHEHGETVYLKQATDYLKANQDKVPFSINEINEFLYSNNGEKAILRGECPGTAAKSFIIPLAGKNFGDENNPSALTHWPVQLHLVNPAASYFQEADLLIAADCTAFAHGDFHRKFLNGKKMVIACPKLDHGKDIYLKKLIHLINESKINTITAVIMEVPCCGGLTHLIQTALSMAERKVPLKVIIISTRGKVISEEWK
jgi:NAD-dependent dihydropyrimidine dehydrogenase PreA subunit